MEKITKGTSTCILFLILILLGCNRSDEAISPSKAAFDTFADPNKIRELSAKLFAGDTVAYELMKTAYFESRHSNEFLYYAIAMSDSNDFPQAYFDVYLIMKADRITNWNSHLNKIANLYLLKAYERNVVSAKSELPQRFGNRKIPSSKSYWEEIGSGSGK